MAPKRSAPPPPPPPPVASSEETASGSGSDDESEEEIAHSPPSAAHKNTAPPPQKVQQPESSDEEEEDDEEEEEEEGNANHATPPSAAKNPAPPPPPNPEESETEEEEEETDDEAPQPKPAPKEVAEGKAAKPPASGDDKKPAGPFQRSWSKDDEVRILEALVAYRREHGTLPQPDALEAALAGSLEKSDYGRKELLGKVKSLKSLYNRTAKRGDLPSKDRDRLIFDLSKEVWGGGYKAANDSAVKEYDEMRERYPFLAEEVKALELAQPGMFKREFGLIEDEKARALDTKIKKQRLVQMKVELRRYDLTKEVTKVLMELID